MAMLNDFRSALVKIFTASVIGVLMLACGSSDDPFSGMEGSGGSDAMGGSPAGGSGGTAPATGGTVGTGGGGSQVRPKIRTVGYLPTYRGQLLGWSTRLDFSRVTHVIIAFAEVDASGTLSLRDLTARQFAEAAHAAGVKVLLAIGGASTIDNPAPYTTLLSAANRDAFVQKISDFLVALDLDGLDVDLEGRGVDGNYGAFVAALVSKLRPQGKLVTAALARWFAESIPPATMQAFDFVNVMAYDQCEFWRNVPCQHSDLQALNSELTWFVSRGVPRDKLVAGVPFYGYRWQASTGQALTYSEILAAYPSQAGTDWFTAGAATIVHNSKATIVQKVGVAKTFGGIMIWELGQDATGDNSLLKAINDVP